MFFDTGGKVFVEKLNRDKRNMSEEDDTVRRNNLLKTLIDDTKTNEELKKYINKSLNELIELLPVIQSRLEETKNIFNAMPVIESNNGVFLLDIDRKLREALKQIEIVNEVILKEVKIE